MSLLHSSLRKVMPVCFRCYSVGAPKDKNQKSNPPAAVTEKPSVKEPVVGPGASKQGPYKNPEYYTYNIMSHYDIENAMKPFRIPQPSSVKK